MPNLELPTFGHELAQEVPLHTRTLDIWSDTLGSDGAPALEQSPLILHISGPSGIGKRTKTDELVTILEAEGVTVRTAKSATTREYRNPDDKKQYHLLRYSGDEDIGREKAINRFDDLWESGKIIEVEHVPGKDGLNKYGLLLEEEDLQHPGVTIVETTVEALKNIKPDHNDSKNPLSGMIAFYLMPPGETVPEMLESLAKRMLQRPGESPESIHARIWGDSAVTPTELTKVVLGEYPIDYIFVNHDNENVHASGLVVSAMSKIIFGMLSARKQMANQALPI